MVEAYRRSRRRKTSIIALILIATLVTLVPPSTANEILVTNVFDSTDLSSVLRDVSAQTGVNIIAEPAVQGWVTLELFDVPLEKALEMILTPLGYTFVKVDDYYVVGSADVASPIFPLLSRTEVVKLNYIGADRAANQLSDHFKANVKVNTVENTVTITGTEAQVARIKADLALLDQPSPQVVLEAVVMEVTVDAGNSLRADWRYEGKSGPSDPGMPGSGFIDFVSGIWGGKISLTGGLHQALASIKFLVDSGKARIHASPRLAALDGESAEIFLGKDRYYLVTTSNGAATTSSRLESIRTGISLKFTPRVAADGQVFLKIQPEVSDAVEGPDGLPLVSTRRASTTVLVRDGETLVIGGLKLESEYESESKVPILGDLPVMGLLLSSTKKESVETETVILISPKILYPGQPAEVRDDDSLH